MMKQRLYKMRYANYFTILLFLGVGFTSSVLDAQVSGIAFRDFNGNGTKDTYEPGVAGITVKAYDNAGVQVGTTATTSSTGTWSITTGTTVTLRVEFLIPTTNTDPTGAFASVDFSSASGATYGSSVQFVAGNATGVNFAINAPNDYWNSSITPKYVVPCYANGLATGTAANDAAIVSTLYSSTGLNSTYTDFAGVRGMGPVPRVDAKVSQVGTVWGAAYHKEQKHFYFSTFLKRTSGMADGPGYIYNFDYSGASPSLSGKFNLQGATPVNGGSTIDFGTVTRTGSSDYTLPSNKTLPSVDIDAFAKVGVMSMGDIDIQPSTNYLWAVNLYQKALIRVDISGNPISLPSGINQYILSGLPGYPTSATGVLRPWALAFNAGKGYLGVVADASISKNDANLLVYVLQFDPNNIAAGFTQVLSFNPNIKRGSLAAAYKFHYWISTYSKPPILDADAAAISYAQPILSDIDFDENGNMILSIMDRFGHQMGFYNYPPINGANQVQVSFTFGEVLKACSTGTGWAVEGSGTCNTGPEFFQDIAGDANPESGMGASAILKGKNQILEVGIDPHPSGSTGNTYWDTQGVYTYNLTTGANVNWYSVYFGDLSTQYYGKTNGLGDLEFITDPAPLEIGNRVWNDANSNGIQDPNEAGINGVIVELYDGATKVGTTTTASGGQYYFNKTNVNLGGATEVKPNTAYTIKIAASQYNNTGVASTPLSTLTLTTANATSTGLVDVANNDATAVSGIATIAYTTGNYGENNHTLDFGFKLVCIEPKITAVAANIATCTAGVANSDAAVHVTGITGMAKYAYSTNGTTGLFANTATVSTASSIDLTALANPASATTYTFRIYAIDTTCYNDTTLVLTPSVCTSVDLSLTKTVNNSAPTQGSNVVFTIKVKNEGTGNATGVTVHDTLPVGMTFISATPNGVYDAATKLWTIGNLNASAETTLTMTVRIDSVGLSYNTAEVHALNETDTDSSPNNGLTNEDDIARVCVTVPVPLCTSQGKTLSLTIPTGFTNIKWFKNGVEISGQTANILTVTQIGDYTFTATEVACPVEGCCPLKVVEGNCTLVCKPVICLPVTVSRVN